MRLMLAATAATLIFSAAIAASAPTPMMGSGTMMGSSSTMGSTMSTKSGTMMIHHKVADFGKWRIAYDADQLNRTAAGLTNCRVQRSMDDATDVVISCNMADLTKAKTFATSKALADTMSKAGVVGKPEILFLSPPR